MLITTCLWVLFTLALSGIVSSVWLCHVGRKKIIASVTIGSQWAISETIPLDPWGSLLDPCVRKCTVTDVKSGWVRFSLEDGNGINVDDKWRISEFIVYFTLITKEK